MNSQLYIVFFLFCFSAQAQNGTPPTAGARGLAMGNAAITFTGINSAFGNQAGLAQLDDFTVILNGEQRFLLSEIQSFSMAAALPASSGTLGIILNYFGFEEFNEQRIGLVYGRKLFDKLSIGAQLFVLNTRIPEYGNKSVFSFELGLLSELLPQLSIGAHISSPLRIETAEGEFLPTVLKLGFAYFPSELLTLTAEVEKDIDYPASVKAGIEYRIVVPLFLRLGLATKPTAVSFGIGYALKSGLSIDFASSYHQVLGFSPAISLSFQRKKSNSQ